MSFRNFSPFPKCHAKSRDGSGVWEGNACCVIAFLRLPTVTLIEKRVADDNRTTSMKLSHPCLFRRMIQNHECWRTWCVYTTWHIIIHCSKYISICLSCTSGNFRVFQISAIHFVSICASWSRKNVPGNNVGAMKVKTTIRTRKNQQYLYIYIWLLYTVFFILLYTYCHFVHNLIWLSLCGCDL